MRYNSKPHSIRAFQFRPTGVTKYPEWFERAKEENRVQVTNNHKDRYITIYYREGLPRRAYADEWVCINDSNNIFPLTEEEFERGFGE